MGHGHAHNGHPHRPFVSRREFLRKSALVGGAAAAGPWFWRRLANAADAPISQLHLTHGHDAAREMRVSWMTSAPVETPFVQLSNERIAAHTTQYAGYPGYFHHARLAGLTPATPYQYEVGHAGKVASRVAQFRTSEGRRAPFTFTAFGDQGTEIPVGQPPNQPQANTDLARAFNPSFHLIVGDLAYAEGNQFIWDDWFSMISPMASRVPWMPTIGNHEVEADFLGAAGNEGSWGKWGYDPYRHRFDLPDNGHADLYNCFYSFRFNGVHFVCIDNNDVNAEYDTNRGYTAGRQQAWVAAEFARARLDPEVDFIVVQMHQCAFSSSSKHGSDEGVRKAWFDLFAAHSVDLVFQGHDHVYERTHAMRGDKVVGRGESGPIYRSDVGTTYITAGNGGAVQEPFSPDQPEWSAHRTPFKIGTVKVEVDPDGPGGMARMIIGEYWALDGSPIEEGIVLQRPSRRSLVGGGAPVAGRETRSPEPDTVLPTSTGPAGVGMVALGALAGTGQSKSLDRVTPEAREDEIRHLRS